MKFTTKLLIFWSSVFLIFLLGIILVMSVFWDVSFNYWQLLVAFIINGVIPPAIIISFFYKRLEYMESEDDSPPKFSGVKSKNLLYKARKNKILKFRTDSRMLSWGIGGYLRMANDETIEVFVYPIHKHSRREKLILNQTLRVLCSTFNQC